MIKTANTSLKTWLLSIALVVAVTITAVFGLMPAKSAKADGIPEIIEGKVRVQILSESVIRVERAKSDGTFCDSDTLQIVGRSEFEGAEYDSAVSGGTRVITIGANQLFIPENAQSLSGVYFADAEGNELWKYSGTEDNSGELPSPSETPTVHVLNDTPRVVAPSWGYTDVGSTDPYNGYTIEQNVKDLYILVPNGDSKKMLSDYVALTGRTNMLPLSAFGLWNSRYYKYTEETVKEQVAEYKEYDVPLDNFVIDTDWNDADDEYADRFGGYGTGYGVDLTCFPDMEGFLEWMHENNLFVMFNDHPRTVDGATHALDPADVAYRNEGLNKLLDIGADAWWYDRNWYVSLVAPSAMSGINKETLGMYIYYYVTDQHYAELAEANGDEYARRSLVMTNLDNISNGTYVGIDNMASHRYGYQWTGDISASEKGLAQEIENVVKAGKNSLPYVSSDLGGHNGQPATDLYIRWMQYGALSPIYRTHSANAANYQRLPWLFGEQALEVVRDYIKMRYRLLPLYYALSHENYETGLPLARSLEFDYPQYEESKRNDQYLLGENILVAPLSGDVAAKAEDFKDLVIYYYDNKDLAGSPYASFEADAINFNWGNGAPVAGHNGDNFSAIVEGKLTPQEDSRYAIVSDDGCRVYINDILVVDHWQGSDSEKFDLGIEFKEGRTYNIRVEYFEGSGGASLTLMKDSNNSRDVFIPDGEWIDVFTGNSFVGPKTIKVKHEVDSSPIFVKAGSVTALAEDMLNTNDKDWSNLALDWYPSTSEAENVSVLYEDDTKTKAYMDGKFRTTEYGTRYNKENGTAELFIGAAQGSFSGDRAFTTRNWKVRIHSPYGWGAPTSVVVNGENVTAEVVSYTRDRYASPFSYTGAGADGSVYEVSFTADVTDESLVEVKFDSYERDDTVVEDKEEFSVETFAMDRTEGVDLTSSIYSDYLFITSSDGAYGNSSYLEYRKPGVDNSGIGAMTYPSSLHGLNDNLPFKADGISDNKLYRNGAYSNIAGATWGIDVTVSGKGKIVFFVNGYNGKSTLVVKDERGGMKSVSFTRGGNSYDRAEISYDESEEHTYSLVFSRSDGNASVAAVAIKPAQELDYGFSVREELLGEHTDLESAGNQDWIHFFGASDTHPEKQTFRKDIPVENRYISEYVSDGASPATFYDYKTVLYYSNATSEGGKNANVSAWGTGNKTGTYSFTVKADDKTEYIKFYLVAWREGLALTVKDGDKIVYEGWPIWQASDGGSGIAKCLVLDVDIPDGQTKTFDVSFKNALGLGNHTNSCITAVAVGHEPYEPTDVKLLEKGSINNLTADVDLTAEGTKDWFYFGEGSNNVGKKDGTYFGEVTGSDVVTNTGASAFKGISWTDGDTTESATGLTGMSTSKQGTQLHLNLKAGESVNLKLYFGAINAKATLIITDSAGSNLVKESFTATSTALKSVEYSIKSATDQTLRITLIATERQGEGAVFLVAGAVGEFSCVNHTWGVGVQIKEASCTQRGEIEYTCSRCFGTRIEYEPQLQHSFNQKNPVEENLKSAATCNKAATYFYTCACGEKGGYYFTHGEPTGEHAFTKEEADDDYLASEATCGSPATYYKSCEVCGAAGEETFTYGTAGEHAFNQEVADSDYLASEANCTEPAKYYKSCSCGEAGEETFDYGEALGHTLPDLHTCHDRVCSVCEATVEATTQHTWNQGEVTKEPTIEEKGEKTFTCTACGATKTEDIDKLEDGGSQGGGDSGNDGNDGNQGGNDDESEKGSCATVAPTNGGNGFGGGMALFVITLFGIAAILATKKRRN